MTLWKSEIVLSEMNNKVLCFGQLPLQRSRKIHLLCEILRLLKLMRMDLLRFKAKKFQDYRQGTDLQNKLNANPAAKVCF